MDVRHGALRTVYKLGWLQTVTYDPGYLGVEGARGMSVGEGGGSRRYFSCSFERVPRLVKSRQVVLRDGKAVLMPWQVSAAVVQHFEDRLRHGIAVAKRCLPGVEADERVAEILRQVFS